MSSTKPAVVIVAGSFYSEWHYRHLHNGLTDAGYNVTTIGPLPSTRSDKPNDNIDPDVAATAAAIKSYIDKDQNVVVVMHSFGGLVGNCACKGLLPSDQPNGKGVVALVHLCAGVPLEGMSMMDGAGGQTLPWWRLIDPNGKEPAVPNSGVWLWVDGNGTDPGNLFFHDCSPEEKAEAVRRLQYFSEGCTWSKATYAAWKHVESNFLICTEDHAMPPMMQEAMPTMGDAEGIKTWKRVERIAASHSPFMSMPQETTNFVRRCCGEEL
jgi:pimeloyl-ACP methyl ester carboxylesterase